MTYRTKPHNTLVVGDWIADCDVCGFRFHASDLRKRWDELMVCKDDWEVRQPQDFVKGLPDNSNVPWSRPPSTADSSYTDAGGTAHTTDNTPDLYGDESATLTAGTTSTIVDWNTDLTTDRTVTLSTSGAIKDDRFTIYRTGGGDYDLIIGSIQTTPVPSITGIRFNGSAWELEYYTPTGL